MNTFVELDALRRLILRHLLISMEAAEIFDPDDHLEFEGDSDEGSLCEDESHENMLLEDDLEWP